MDYRMPLILRRLALGTMSILALPLACIYPEYSFNEPEPGSAGGGSTSSSGGQGGGMPGVENCQNGEDDDGDSLADCADTDCAAYACVAAPPLGWEGYVSLFDGAEVDKPAACPTTYPTAFNGHRNLLNTTAHTCSACTCGAPTGQTCDLAGPITVGDKACGAPGQTVTTLTVPADWQGECVGDSAAQGGRTNCPGGACNTSVTMPAVAVVGGTCAAAGGESDQLPAQWEAFGLGCSTALQGGGCAAGSVCQAKSTTPFRSGLCVYKLGENSCPIGEFSQQFLYYEKADDTRMCSKCECDAPSGTTCAAKIHVYSDVAVNTCNTEVASFDAGSCTALTGNPTVFGRAATMLTGPTGGQCAVMPGGGDASGTIVAVNPTTFCCIP